MSAVYDFINQLINSGEQIAESAHANNELNCSLLIRLESVIDEARTAVPAGSGFEYPEEKKQMEENLNKFRKTISELVNQSDKVVVKQKLQESHRMTESMWGL